MLESNNKSYEWGKSVVLCLYKDLIEGRKEERRKKNTFAYCLKHSYCEVNEKNLR